MIPARIEISPLSAGQYYNLRHKYYYRSGLIEWTEGTCDYILSYIDYCQGQAVEINNGESYLLSYPSPENNEIIVCEEAGLELQAENLPTILSAIRTLYPNAAKTLLYISTQSPKEDFLLCKPAHHIPGGPHFLVLQWNEQSSTWNIIYRNTLKARIYLQEKHPECVRPQQWLKAGALTT